MAVKILHSSAWTEFKHKTAHIDVIERLAVVKLDGVLRRSFLYDCVTHPDMLVEIFKDLLDPTDSYVRDNYIDLEPKAYIAQIYGRLALDSEEEVHGIPKTRFTECLKDL